MEATVALGLAGGQRASGGAAAAHGGQAKQTKGDETCCFLFFVAPTTPFGFFVLGGRGDGLQGTDARFARAGVAGIYRRTGGEGGAGNQKGGHAQGEDGENGGELHRISVGAARPGRKGGVAPSGAREWGV